MRIGWDWELIFQVESGYGTVGYGDRVGRNWCVGDGGEWNKKFLSRIL